VLALCNSLDRVYDFGMKQFTAEVVEIHQDIQAIEHINDVPAVDTRVESLVDQAVNQLDAVLNEAEVILLSARALANRSIIEKL